METFAKAQRGALTDVSIPIPGGMAGHTVSPMSVAGCYAPGGRYPLPSSVIMTAVTARAAGVSKVGGEAGRGGCGERLCLCSSVRRRNVGLRGSSRGGRLKCVLCS